MKEILKVPDTNNLKKIVNDDPIVIKSSTEPIITKSCKILGNLETIAAGEASEPANTQQTLKHLRSYKNRLYALPRPQKHLRLARYLNCQSSGCKCIGWRKQPININRNYKNSPTHHIIDSTSEACKHCAHPASQHISHLPKSENATDRLLDMVAEMEYLCMRVRLVNCLKARYGYFYLIGRLRRSILTMTRPLVEPEPFGWPPFEKPSVRCLIRNFVTRRLAKFTKRERSQIVTDLEAILIDELDRCVWPSPGGLKDDAKYSDLYVRWIIHCYVPKVCEILPHFDATEIFGKTMLRKLYLLIRKRLVDRFNNVRWKNKSVKKYDGIVNQCPKFLKMLEMEIYSDDSPMWTMNYETDLEMPNEVQDDTVVDIKKELLSDVHTGNITKNSRPDISEKSRDNDEEANIPLQVKQFIDKVIKTDLWSKQLSLSCTAKSC